MICNVGAAAGQRTVNRPPRDIRIRQMLWTTDFNAGLTAPIKTIIANQERHVYMLIPTVQKMNINQDWIATRVNVTGLNIGYIGM